MSQGGSEHGRRSVLALDRRQCERGRAAGRRPRRAPPRERGTATPIVIEISNSAGLCQLDQLLLSKLRGSGLEGHLEINVRVGKEEKRLLEDFTL